MEQLKPVDNSKLKELLQSRKDAKSDDEIRGIMEQVFTIFVEQARLLSPVRYSEPPRENPDGTVTLKKGTTLKFPMLATPDNKYFYPAFTDIEELKKGEKDNENPTAQALSFDDYAKLIIDMHGADGLVIDPFGENLLIVKEQVQAFRKIKQNKMKKMDEYEVVDSSETPEHLVRVDKSSSKTDEIEDEVKVGEPTFYPDDLTDAICEHAKKQENINAIWLLLMERNGERSYLLILDYTGDEETTYNGIVDAARPYLDDMYLDIMPYDGEFGKNVTKDKEPFYKKI